MKSQEFVVTITELNERGYGVARLDDGTSVCVLNALPGEEVKVESFKRKNKVLFARAIEILTPSPYRIPAREEHFLASSPWQIMQFDYENEVKAEMIVDFFAEEHIVLEKPEIEHDKREFGYRNKVEFGFYSHNETNQLDFAYFKREGNKGKYPLTSCALMPDDVNNVALSILTMLRELGANAKQLKSLILRYSFSQKTVVAALFLKDDQLVLPENILGKIVTGSCVGFHVYYSDYRSPASIVTNTLFSSGSAELEEEILGLTFHYSLNGFFQVNPPLFEKAAQDIVDIINKKPYVEGKKVIDLYAGVGTIGLCCAAKRRSVRGVEIFPGSRNLALKNARLNDLLAYYSFTEASAEKSLEYITSEDILIVDPPRVGLHADVIKRILEVQPELVIYLSCNPKTQAENIALLADVYDITSNKGYNFYPHTPHCEHLVVLEKKQK